jgi:hypothetical protein
MVKGKETRTSRIQVVAARSTRRFSFSPRQSNPSTTSTPTPRPYSSSRSLRLFWPISTRPFFLPRPRLPLCQSYPTRLPSTRRSTTIPHSNLPTNKSPSLVLLRPVLWKLPSASAASLSSFPDPSASTILSSAASFLQSALYTVRVARSIQQQYLPCFCP